MAKAKVNIVFQTQNKGVGGVISKITGALNKLGAQSKKTSDGMSQSWQEVSLKVAATFLAVQQAARIVGDLVNAYTTQATAEIKLNAALKATGNQVGITSKEMLAMANAMSDVTAIGDEVIIGAQGILTTFTKIGGDVFPKALNAAADMSAMFGQDLKQSAIQLGTALNDPIAGIGRLRRIGISFTAEQKNSIQQFVEQNDIMSAQGVILAELEAEFGGVAEAMGQAAIGGVKRFSNAIGDTKEVIGELLVNGFSPLINNLIAMTNSFRESLRSSDTFRVVIKALADGAGFLIDILASVAESVGPVITSIVRFIQSFAEATGSVDLFKSAIGLAVSTLKDFLSFVSDGLNLLSDLIDSFNGIDVAARKQSKALKESSKSVSDLLISYDQYITKSNKTTKEQEDLNKIIEQLAEVVPGAVTAVDSYGDAMNINKRKVQEFLAVNTQLQIQLGQEQVKATAKNLDFLRQVALSTIKAAEGNQTLSEAYVRLRAGVVAGTVSIAEFRKEAERIQRGSELTFSIDTAGFEDVQTAFREFQDARKNVKDLEQQLRDAFKETTAAVNDQSTATDKANTVVVDSSEAWGDVLGLLNKFDDPLQTQLRNILEIQTRIQTYAGAFQRGSKEFKVWQQVTELVGVELFKIQKSIDSIDQSAVILRMIGGDEILQIWDNVKKVNESVTSETDSQRKALESQLSSVQSFLSQVQAATGTLSEEQVLLQENIVAQAQEAVDAITQQLNDLEIAPLKDNVEDIARKYEDVFATESAALAAKMAALNKESQDLKSYLKLLKDRASLLAEQGTVNLKLNKEISKLERVSGVVNGEIEKLSKSIKGTSKETLSVWDLVIRDITGSFREFSDNAKQRFAEAQGVEVGSLSAEQEDTAVQASIASSALSGLASVAVYLVNAFIDLIVSTEVWQNAMEAFQDVLTYVIEFAVVPLVEAIQPLFTIVIALVSVLANLIVPVFEVVGQLIQRLTPLFVVLGQIILSAVNIVLKLLPLIIVIVNIFGNLMVPVLMSVATLFDLVAVILEALAPVLNVLVAIVIVIANVFAVLAGTLQWIINIIFNLGKFIANLVANPFNPKKWNDGMRNANLGNLISEAVSSVNAAPELSDVTSDLATDIPLFDQEFVFGGDGTTQFEAITPGADGGGIFGGATTVTQVPDINIQIHFHAEVIGEGGKESVGEYMVEAVQDYLGVGGTVTWLEEVNI